MGLQYDWQRRWHPRYVNSQFDVSSTTIATDFLALWQLQTSQQGFLFEDIKSVPCLILLGEPGQGKTYFVRSEFRRIDTELATSDDEAMLVDLQGSNSPQYIHERLFSGNTKYLNWKSGSHRLTIFLDSVDRTQTAVEDVITVLTNELRSIDVTRLSLRLVCRDYDWSFTLADTLRDVWGDQDDYSKVQVYQLAPLGISDIAQAASSNSIPPQDFLNSIRQMDAMPLASSPITLEMLLKRYPSIAKSRLELYLDGVKSLCTKGKMDDHKFLTKLNARFEMAARIAAVMILGNKYSVDFEGGKIDEFASVMATSELLLNKASTKEEQLLLDTLNTSLFRGTQQRQWAHQSFAEYLAAYHLSSLNIPIKEIIDRTTTTDNVFAPQLHETIRWLSLMRDDVFEEVISRQPTILLAMDLSHITESDFRRLASKLLNLDDEYVYVGLHNDLRQQRIRINHPSLQKLLVPYLNNKSLSRYLRRFVIGLIDRFGLIGFDDQLLAIVNDSEEGMVLRKLSADALWNVGGEEAKKSLKPFIYGVKEDTDDELKGYALLSLWSQNLTAQELFDVLTPPKKQSFFGAYSRFLADEKIMSELTPSDLPFALRWVTKQPQQHNMDLALVRVASRIMMKAWDNLHYPQVMDEFAKTAYSISMRHDNIFLEGGMNWRNRQDIGEYTRKFFNDGNTRRNIVLAMLPQITQGQTPDYFLTGSSLPYLFRDDLDWVLQQLSNAKDFQIQTVWANVISRLLRGMTGYNFTPQNLVDIDKIYYASETNPTLADLIKQYFVSILDDPDAIRVKKHYYESKEYENKYRIEPPNPPPLERIEDALSKIENGDIAQWVNVIMGLRLSSDGRRRSLGLYEFNVQEFPSWEECNLETHQRIVDAAKIFVLQQTEFQVKNEGDDWYITNEIPYVELFGYLAIFLLVQVDFEFLSQLSESRWVRWSKIIVWYPFKSAIQMDREEKDRRLLQLQEVLLRFVYEQIPDQIVVNLIELIDAENSKNRSIYSEIHKFDKCWDITLENALLAKVQDASFAVIPRQNLIDFLLRHDSKNANVYAEAVINNSYANEDEKELVKRFCVSLMNYSQDMNWSTVWNVISSEIALGKAIIETVAAADHRQGYLAQKLDAQELANLFIWVEEQYPSDEDPDVDGMHTVTNREQVGNWRNRLITALRSINDPQVLSEIRRLTNHFPDLHWLQFVRVDVEKATQGAGWKPSSPSDLLIVIGTKHLDRQPLKLVTNMSKWFLQDMRWLIALIIAVIAILIPIFQSEIRIALGLDQVPTSIPSVEQTDVVEPTVLSTLQFVEETEEFPTLEETETVMPGGTP